MMALGWRRVWEEQRMFYIKEMSLFQICKRHVLFRTCSTHDERTHIRISVLKIFYPTCPLLRPFDSHGTADQGGQAVKQSQLPTQRSPS